MKKTIALFAFAAALGLAACDKDEPEVLPGGDPVNESPETPCGEGEDCQPK